MENMSIEDIQIQDFSNMLKWSRSSSYLLRINNAFDIEVKLVPPASKL